VAEAVVTAVDHLGFFLVVIIELVAMNIRHHVDHLAVLMVHFHTGMILKNILQQQVDFLQHHLTNFLIVLYLLKHYGEKINQISIQQLMFQIDHQQLPMKQSLVEVDILMKDSSFVSSVKHT
jgi:hypothetical protein